MKALGEDEIQAQLVPWLEEYVQRDDAPDEMCFEIAKAISAHVKMISQPDMFYPILD